MGVSQTRGSFLGVPRIRIRIYGVKEWQPDFVKPLEQFTGKGLG